MMLGSIYNFCVRILTLTPIWNKSIHAYSTTKWCYMLYHIWITCRIFIYIFMCMKVWGCEGVWIRTIHGMKMNFHWFKELILYSYWSMPSILRSWEDHSVYFRCAHEVIWRTCRCHVLLSSWWLHLLSTASNFPNESNEKKIKLINR